MKKILFLLAIVCPVLFSCSDESLDAGKGDDVLVCLDVDVPAVTKSGETEIGDGKNVDILYYEVWSDAAGVPGKKLSSGNVARTAEKEFDLELKLLSDQTYHFLFWAQVDGKDVYDVTSLRNVVTDYSKVVGNDEDRAAFFAAEKIAVDANLQPRTIYLYRPFAQLNIATVSLQSDMQEDEIVVKGTKVTVSSPATCFDVATGTGKYAGTPEKGVFTATGVPQNPGMLEIENTEYHYLSMNYFFVNGDDKNTVDVDVEFYTDYGTVKRSIVEVPVKENFKTNILGDLLFKTADFKIVVEEGFNAPDYIK